MDDIKQLPIPFANEPQEPIDLQSLFLEAIDRSEKKLHITIK